MAGQRRQRQVGGVAMKIGRFSTVILVLLSSFSLAVLSLLRVFPLPYSFGVGSLADLFGFLALALIAATGVLMLFKKSLTATMESPESLWRLHIVIAGAGGFFLGLHVVLFLAFPLSLPVLLGYAATGAALFVWITGGVYFQGVRNSIFYHGLLSIVGIFLMVVHTFGAGRNIPMELSGLSLAVIAVVVLAGVARQVLRSWKAEHIPTGEQEDPKAPGQPSKRKKDTRGSEHPSPLAAGRT
jgi:hypothetical protein